MSAVRINAHGEPPVVGIDADERERVPRRDEGRDAFQPRVRGRREHVVVIVAS